MSSNMRVDDITEALRQRIISGEFGTAGRLPSLRMFADQFGTTQETMNKVFQHLQAEGLIISLGRRGVFVRMPRRRIAGIVPRFDLYLKDLGLEPVEEDLEEPTILDAPSNVAEVMKIQPGTPVVRRIRRQGTKGVHYRIAENFYPVELAGGEILELIKKDVHADVLQAIKEKHGKVIKRVHEEVISRLPTREEQELLAIVRSAPVLEVTRVNYAEDDSIIMYNRLILVASYFVLSYDYPVEHWS